MDIQPIRTDDDLSKAIAEIETLWGAEQSTADGDKLDALITLVDRYEDEHYPIGPAHPVDVLKMHMEMTGRRRADLASLIGSSSAVLNRRRALTLDMVHKLNRQWGIPAEYLVVPYEVEDPAVKPVRRAADSIRKRT